MSATRHATRQALGRVVQRLAWLGALVLALRLLTAVAGPLIAAAAGSVLFVVAGVRWWARLEARLFAPPRLSAQEIPRSPPIIDERRHLAFARALAVVAARYLAECEAENSP